MERTITLTQAQLRKLQVIDRYRSKAITRKKAAELLGEMPENCVVIEDSFNGIRAAKAAGMTAIMVPDQLVPDEEISKLADFVLPSLVVVKDRLESLK